MAQGEIQLVFGADTRSFAQGMKNVNTSLSSLKQRELDLSASTSTLRTQFDDVFSEFSELKKLSDAGVMIPADKLQAFSENYSNLKLKLKDTNTGYKELNNNIKTNLSLMTNAAKIADSDRKKATLRSNALIGNTLLTDTVAEANEIGVMQQKLDNLAFEYNKVTKTNKNFKESVEDTDKVLSSSALQMTAFIYGLRRTLRVISTNITEFVKLRNESEKLEREFKISLSDASDYANAKVSNFLTNMSNQLNYNLSDLQKNASMFAQMADGYNDNADAAAIYSAELVRIAHNMTALHQIDLDHASEVLQAALMGRARELQRITGIKINDSLVKQFAKEKGLIADVNAELSENVMFQLRRAYLLQESKKRYGGIVNDNVTLTGLARQINANISSTKENLGFIVEGPLKIFMQSMLVLSKMSFIFTDNFKNSVSPLKNVTVLMGTMSVLGIGLVLTWMMLTVLISKYNALAANLVTTQQRQLLTSIAWLSVMTAGLAMLVGSYSVFENIGKTSNSSLGNLDDSMQNLIKDTDKLKSSLLGFDELNVMNETPTIDYEKMQGMFDFDGLLEGFDDSLDNVKAMTIAIGVLSAAFGLFNLILAASKIGLLGFVTSGISAIAVQYGLKTATAEEQMALQMSNAAKLNGEKLSYRAALAKIKEAGATTSNTTAENANTVSMRYNAETKQIEIVKNAESAASSATETAAKNVNTGATIANTAAQHSFNIAKAIGLSLLGVGAVVGIGFGIASAVQSAQTANTIPTTAPTQDMVSPSYDSSSIYNTVTNETDNVVRPVQNAPQQIVTNPIVNVKIGERDFNQYVYKVVNDENRRNTGISLEKLSAQSR